MTRAAVTRFARAAGVAYVLIMLIAWLNVSLVDSKLVVAGDDATTASNILANEGLFRVGIVGTIVLYASVVVLAFALYVVLEAVDARLAMLAMLLRVSEGVLGAATAFISLAAVLLLKGEQGARAFEAHQVAALVGRLIELRTAALDVVLVFVGLGGTVFCYLFYKSRYVPRALAGWGVFTYLSMLGLSCVSVVVPSHPVTFETLLYGAGGLFEFVFGLWLIVKGVDVRSRAS